MKILLKNIKIKNRIRQEFGNIDELAKSMNEVGLIQPIVVDDKNNLLAGQRRYIAAKKLGWKEIDFIRIIGKNPLLIELYENSQRKGWTCDEFIKIREKIEAARETEWNERKREGVSDKEESVLIGKKTVDVMAEITGEKRTTIHKKLQISKAAKEYPKKYQKYLEKVDSGVMSPTTAMREITRAVRNKPDAIIPEGKWSVVIMDPPLGDWDNQGQNGAADNNFGTMTKKELMEGKISGVDIRTLFDTNCIMYLAMPASRIMTDAADIFRALGFEPITNFIWDKDEIKTGWRQRNQHEHYCIGIKGKMPLPAILHSSIHKEKPPSRMHSKKPYGIYERVLEEYPFRNILEIFGKEKYSKEFTVIGNEYNPNEDSILERKKKESVEKFIKKLKKKLKRKGLEIDWEKVTKKAEQNIEGLAQGSKYELVAEEAVNQTIKELGVIIKI